MSVDDTVKQYPVGAIFEVFFDEDDTEFNRAGSYIFVKISDEEMKLLEYHAVRNVWTEPDGRVMWSYEENNGDMFKHNGAEEVVFHGMINE